jgi:hypothetical protein
MVTKKLHNHIEEFLSNKTKSADFIELFEAKNDNVDLRTDLTLQEIPLIVAIHFNHEFLKKRGIPSPFGVFINQFERSRVSLDRKSRAEFVDINKKERFENNLEKFNSIAQLQKVKQ